MTTQVNQLEKISWIRDFDCTLGSIMFLDPKPRQEDITAIDDFVWY